MSAKDPTLAERSRRHRARLQERQAEDLSVALTVAMRPVLEALEALRNGQESLAQAVDKLAPPRSRSVDKALRNGSDDSADSASLRNGRRAPARARVGTEAPAPYGGLGASTSWDTRADAWRVLQVLTVPGSAGSIQDALAIGAPAWPLARITEALVHLQAQGQVRREPGQGAAPDRWVPVPLEEVPPEPPPERLAIVPAPEVHVTCQDYQAHALDHRWDPDLGTFVCPVCITVTMREERHGQAARA